MLLNLDSIAGANVPMLAAIQKVLPVLELPYTIIVVIGVFTTIVGYLWSVGRRFAEDKTMKQRIIVIVMAAVGVTVGSMIPLANLVNMLFPIAGYVGIFIFICLLVIEGKRIFGKSKAS